METGDGVEAMLVADDQPAEPAEPGEGPLNDPAVAAKFLAALEPSRDLLRRVLREYTP